MDGRDLASLELYLLLRVIRVVSSYKSTARKHRNTEERFERGRWHNISRDGSSRLITNTGRDRIKVEDVHGPLRHF